MNSETTDEKTGDELFSNEQAGGNTHWQDWEYGCLIDNCIKGESFESIGRRLDGPRGRTAAAVHRMWQRLLAGIVEPPEAYKQKLEDARPKFLTPPPAGAKSVMISANAVEHMRQAVEQYKKLSAGHGEITGYLANLAGICVTTLAAMIVGDLVTTDEVTHTLDPNASALVLAKVEHIREYRRRRAGLADQQEPQPTQEGANA